MNILAQKNSQAGSVFIKKMWNKKKELKVNLWDAAAYLKLLFLKYSSQ